MQFRCLTGRSAHIFVAYLFLSLVCAIAAFSQVENSDQAAYETGANLYRAGDCARAIPSLITAAHSIPKANLLLGQCYLDMGKAADAITSLKSYTSQNPDEDRGAILLARAQQLLDPKASEAIATLTTYLSKHPDSLAVRDQLGHSYFEAGQKTNASEKFKEVLSRSQDDPSALLGLGMLASSEAHWSEAIQYLNRVLTAAPEEADAYRALGDVYQRQGQCDLAVAPYSAAFKLRPSEFSTAKALAMCYASLGKWEEVAVVLRSGSEAEARDPEATKLVAEALKKNPQALEEYCQQVLTLNAANASAIRILAMSLDSSKQQEKARQMYLAFLKLEPDDPDINLRLGQIAEDGQQFPEARKYYETAVKSKAATPLMRLALARVDVALKDAPAAKEALSGIGAPLSDTPEYKMLLVQAELDSNDAASARPILDSLLAEDPSNKAVLSLAADCAEKQGQADQELQFLDRLLQTDPQNKQVRYRLVKLITNSPELKQDERAVELLSEFVNLQENDPEGYLLLANLYRKNKEIDKAKNYFELGFKRMPNPIPPRFAWAYLSRGMIYLDDGNLEEAANNLRKATELSPNDPVSLYYLAMVYLKKGDKENLLLTRDQLLSRDPKTASQLDLAIKKAGMKLENH